MAQLVARLVRNEKVGGSNPPSSTADRHPIRMSVFCMPGRCCRWCSGRRACFVGPGCLVCPWAAARPRAVRAASFARRVVSKPGQAPPPPTGTAAWPSIPPAPSTPVVPGVLACGLCFVSKPGQAPPPPTGTAAWPCIPPAPSTPAAPGALTCRAAGCACGFSVPPTPVAMGVLRHAKPSCRVSPTCRRLGWRNSPRWVAVRSRFEVVWPPKCRPIGRKLLKMACFG